MATKTLIFMKVPHDLFKFTTADENGDIGGSVGADLRAATSLNWEVAARSAAPTMEPHFHKSLSCVK